MHNRGSPPLQVRRRSGKSSEKAGKIPKQSNRLQEVLGSLNIKNPDYPRIINGIGCAILWFSMNWVFVDFIVILILQIS
jgi:hypothetical protein